MTFEQWLKSQHSLTGKLDEYTKSSLINTERLTQLLKEAWQAGYYVGYTVGYDKATIEKR